MNDRSVFALLAVPAAWVVVGLFNSTTVGVERDGSNGASAEKVEQAPQQKSRRLITACDVLSDYAAQRVQKTESDKPAKVSVSRGGLEVKVASKGEEDKKACNFAQTLEWLFRDRPLAG